MKKKDVKELFKGVKPLEFNWTTAKELLHAPIMTMFSAKLYVSHACPEGCLRVWKEAPVV